MLTHYQERPALGSRVQLALVSAEDEDAEPIFRRLWLEILAFEKRCSRFLPNSELSQFNRAAGTRLPVSAEFKDILLAAQQLGQATNGLFNPFVLPALQRAGYVHSLVPEHTADSTDDHSAKRVVSVDRLEIGDSWAQIPYGTALDLGGCGKGYIGDVLAGVARQYPSLHGFWFAIGGDVITYGVDDQGQPWTVYLQPDPKSDTRIGEVKTSGEGLYAVATSTTLFRRGMQKGKEWHHIIDPRTGQAAESDISVATMCDQSLLKADVLASCAIIVGSTGMNELLAQQEISTAGWLQQDSKTLKTHGTGIVAYGVKHGQTKHK